MNHYYYICTLHSVRTIPTILFMYAQSQLPPFNPDCFKLADLACDVKTLPTEDSDNLQQQETQTPYLTGFPSLEMGGLFT
jgi:hypothetical protein